jgi:predicted alpha/beta hydrolase family esterase
VVILPGNGCTDVWNSNWYGWLARELKERYGESLVVELRDMPDPFVARETEWIPFAKDAMGADAQTLVVGHSSGAVCAMRLAETTRLGGVVLVSACHTDLGDTNERASGYFSRPWDWAAMRGNSTFIHQFHSDDDHLIPVQEARHVAAQLQSVDVGHGEASVEVGGSYTYQELEGHSHFFSPFPELLQVIHAHLAPNAQPS